jgi:exopolyphosphatase/pppGpp-phosphohydrolase
MLDADPLAPTRSPPLGQAQRYVGVDPPVPPYAVGGTARDQADQGSRLDASVLHNVIDYIATTPGNKLVVRHGVAPGRVKTIAAGAVILEALEQRLEVPLKVVRGGVREGALLELVARHRAAA